MNTPDFDPEEFLNRPINPNHIEGIYNYCDRWCERCTMGKHCTNYETNMRFSSANQDLDKKNEEFWQELGQIWENTAKLIHHVAEKQGIDLNALIQTEEVLKDAEERKDRHKKVMKHPMVRQAFKYTDLTDAILFKNNHWLISKQAEWKKMIELEIDKASFLKDYDLLIDSMEIIQWYSPQIMVKLSRALSSAADGEEWQVENGFPKGSDGSAKVALIGIDRSILAWAKIIELFPQKTDDILDLLVMLEQIKNAAENIFPQARAFKRPGFDE